MRISSVAILAAAILAGFTVWITRQAKALEQDLDGSAQKIVLLGKPAPDFRATSIDGRSISPADYRGKKKLVLVFWATWNNGSRPPIMLLSSLAQRLDEANAGFTVAAIAVDDQESDVRQLVTQSKIPFPVIVDHDRALTNSYEIRSIPTLLIVDTDGRVEWGSVGIQRGAQVDFAQHLGLRPGDLRMGMGMEAPHGRGN